jgi:DNA-binding beta-propeller fold protein YncE
LEHKVVKKSLNNHSDYGETAAGNGTIGSGPYMLHWPDGIFVDEQLNLYVADCGNDRIQRFLPGQLNGTTIAENNLSTTKELDCPTGIAFDADMKLFILNLGNSRIVVAEPNDLRCLLGCTNEYDSLKGPQQISFDRYGNIFISDAGNDRIQKFLLVTNSCGKCLKNHSMYNYSANRRMNNKIVCIDFSILKIIENLYSNYYQGIGLLIFLFFSI